jgi:hypothetical protein
MSKVVNLVNDERDYNLFGLIWSTAAIDWRFHKNDISHCQIMRLPKCQVK